MSFIGWGEVAQGVLSAMLVLSGLSSDPQFPLAVRVPRSTVTHTLSKQIAVTGCFTHTLPWMPSLLIIAFRCFWLFIIAYHSSSLLSLAFDDSEAVDVD